ncbi:hypothetical protein, partial [Limosilactobacillus reuteri]|uniref:hypothetical protein n=1 Tax=Limosilactobacillus reuteri TaxID=1598 RepID=UPI001E2DF6FE
MKIIKLKCRIKRYDSNVQLGSYLLLMSLDLVECVSRANARNKKPPAMRVGDKNHIKKASFA